MNSALAGHLRFLAVLALIAAASCGGDTAARDGGNSAAEPRADSLARVRQDSINRAQPGYIVDSILPIEEEVRRFRAAAGGNPVGAFGAGASSREALVRRFAAAVSARDTAQLGALVLSAREFIDLVYPESPYVRPPYRQSPAQVWSQIQWPSRSGFRRLVDRLGGRPLTIHDVECPGQPERQGRNVLHAGCSVSFVSGNEAPARGRLFGTIIERDGRFKFVSLANMY
jgi:hypothetical protein